MGDGRGSGRIAAQLQLPPEAAERLGAQTPSKGERLVAAILLIAAAPLVGFVVLFVLASDGRPAFYRSRRLGRNKRPFDMYKIRTLRRGSHARTGPRILDPRTGLTILGGRFLRDSRLDELPQLWNIVRGEMAFLGPRPERPEIYENLCRSIDGYDRRFAEAPGLIGPSQLFTPHSTDKRLRTRFDNAWLRRRGLRDTRVVLFAAVAVFRKGITLLARILWQQLVASRILRRFEQRRRLPRVRPAEAEVRLSGASARVGRVVDLNEEAVRVEFLQKVAPGDGTTFRMRLELGNGDRPRRERAATLTGRVVRAGDLDGRWNLVMRYEPASTRSRYVLHQYFLLSSLAYPGSNGRVRPRRKLGRAVPSPLEQEERRRERA